MAQKSVCIVVLVIGLIMMPSSGLHAQSLGGVIAENKRELIKRTNAELDSREAKLLKNHCTTVVCEFRLTMNIDRAGRPKDIILISVFPTELERLGEKILIGARDYRFSESDKETIGQEHIVQISYPTSTHKSVAGQTTSDFETMRKRRAETWAQQQEQRRAERQKQREQEATARQQSTEQEEADTDVATGIVSRFRNQIKINRARKQRNVSSDLSEDERRSEFEVIKIDLGEGFVPIELPAYKGNVVIGGIFPRPNNANYNDVPENRRISHTLMGRRKTSFYWSLHSRRLEDYLDVMRGMESRLRSSGGGMDLAALFLTNKELGRFFEYKNPNVRDAELKWKGRDEFETEETRQQFKKEYTQRILDIRDKWPKKYVLVSKHKLRPYNNSGFFYIGNALDQFRYSKISTSLRYQLFNDGQQITDGQKMIVDRDKAKEIVERLRDTDRTIYVARTISWEQDRKIKLNRIASDIPIIWTLHDETFALDAGMTDVIHTEVYD